MLKKAKAEATNFIDDDLATQTPDERFENELQAVQAEAPVHEVQFVPQAVGFPGALM
jgi:hypothetical protein